MADPLASMYPSAERETPAPAAPTPQPRPPLASAPAAHATAATPAAPAQDAASKLYDAAPRDAAPPPAPAPEPGPASAELDQFDPSSDAANALYNDAPETQDRVDWYEPAASSGQELDLGYSRFDKGEAPTPEMQAERAQVADALAAAGAGQTIARDLLADAWRASQESYVPVAPDRAMVELTRLWGREAEAKINSARQLVEKAAAVNPAILDYLERTHLGNDPAFIRKLAARAAAETRRSAESRQVAATFALQQER